MAAAAERPPLVDHPIEVRLRLLRRHAIFEPPDEIEEVARAQIREYRGIERERQVDLDPFVAQVESARHDADDARRHAVDRHDPADRALVAAEVALPRRIGEDGDVFGAGERIGVGEQSAAERRHAEHRQELRGHERGCDPPRTLGGAEADRPSTGGGNQLRIEVRSAEIVNHGGDPRPRRMRQQMSHDRGLACPEEAGHQQDRDRYQQPPHIRVGQQAGAPAGRASPPHPARHLISAAGR